VLKALEGSIIFPILIAVSMAITLLSFVMSVVTTKSQWIKVQELIAFLLKCALYALGTADLRERVLVNNAISSDTNGIFIVFEGYLLALLHQLFLGQLTRLMPKLSFDIGALILRCLIFSPNIYQGSSTIAPLLIQIPFDFAIIYNHFRKEVDDRNQFLQIYRQKEDGKRFKSLIMNSLPESMIVVDSQMKTELFVNEAYKKYFRSSNQAKKAPKHSFSLDCQKIQILKDSVIPTANLPEEFENYLKTTGDITFFEFLRKGVEYRIFQEEPFLLQGIWSLPESKRTPLGRKIFDIKILGLSWEEFSFGIMISDITHRESIIALKAADKNKDKVLASISHELKTPLHIINGMISEIKKKETNPQIMEYANMCETNSNLLLHYINSIIDLQELKKSKFKLRIKKIDIKSFMNEIKGLFQAQCKIKELQLTVEIDQLLPKFIHTDRERLIQIFAHLMSNAVKFTTVGSIALKAIKVPKKEMILFSITDTGKGMDYKDMERLFSAYGRLDSSSVSIRGAGLGLTLSNGLAKVLKGINNERKVINVESVKGKGSEFSFSLPLNLDEDIKADRNQQFYYRQISEKAAEEEQDEINIIYNATTENRTTEADLKGERAEHMASEDDEEYFQELEDLNEAMGEHFVDSNLKAFLSQHGLTLREKILRYKTVTKDNFIVESMKSTGTFSHIEFKKTSVHENSPKSSALKLSPFKESFYHSSSAKFLGFKSNETSPKLPLHPFQKAKTAFQNDGGVPFFKIESATSSTIELRKIRNREYSDGSETCRDLILATENDSTSPRKELPTPREIHQSPSFGTNKSLENEIKLISSSNRLPMMGSREEHSLVPTKAKRVLVVDDNPFNLFVASKFLEDEAFDVLTAISGEKALQRFEESCQENREFDLILMDLQMPIMDGFETTQRLLKMMKDKGLKEIPIVPLTANTDSDSADRCKEVGMKGFLKKPLEKTETLKDLNRIMGISQNRNINKHNTL